LQFKDAQELLVPLGIEIVYDKNLNLYLICIDDKIVYVTPNELQSFNIDMLKVFVAKSIMNHVASNPIVILH